MNPYDFELFVLDIYKRLGWEVESTPRSHDEGIDGFLRKGNSSLVLQCKCYDAGNRVGAPTLYALLGVVEKTKSTGGVLVTTSDFSRKAEEWAEGQRLELVDSTRLQELIKQALGSEHETYEKLLTAEGESRILKLAKAEIAAQEAQNTEVALKRLALIRITQPENLSKIAALQQQAAGDQRLFKSLFDKYVADMVSQIKAEKHISGDGDDE